jgi:putative drug exporter of the RND superfamily
MSAEFAYRWGRTIARRRWAVLGVWVLVLVACGALYPSLQRSLGAPDYGVDGSESSRAAQLLEQRFSGHGAEQDVLVFYSPTRRAGDAAYRTVVAHVLAETSRERYVRGIAGPYEPGAGRRQISSDGHAAIALVGIAGDPRELVRRAESLQHVVDPLARADVRVWLTGYSPVAKDITTVENEDIERAETIGVPVALAILLLALGTVVAAVVPLALAGSGLLLAYGVLALIAHVLTFDSFLTTIVTMIGVGIGIDYALFIVSRFREELAHRMRAGDDVAGERRRRLTDDAVGAAIATSGRTILFSGAIVALALSTLVVIPTPTYREFALGAALVVVCTVIAALTLLPAALAMLGGRINLGALPARWQPRDASTEAADGHGTWARWALAVMRRPLLAASVIVIGLVFAATPLLNLRTGVDFGISSLASTPSGKGEEVLARSFGAGTLAPIEIVVSRPGDHSGSPPRETAGHHSSAATIDSAGAGGLDRADEARVATLARELAPNGHNGIATIAVTQGLNATLVTVAPTTTIDSYASEQLVRHIRATLLPAVRAGGGPDVAVGGASAKVADLSDVTTSHVALVIGLILALSLLLLIVVFRSIVLPIKAVAMNLLATGATVGIVIFIFQYGHGSHLLGFTSTGFIQVYLPLSIFALLFGLSMDYEVFLIRRMREAWLATHDNELAVATGVEHTARPISAAAAIMVAVFGSFATANVLELKQFGIGLALAIAIDATLIRLILVPALMRLFGARNWWLPALRRAGQAPATGMAEGRSASQ